MALKVMLQLFAEGGGAEGAAESAVDARGADLNAAFEAITGQKGEFAASVGSTPAAAGTETAGEKAGADVAGPKNFDEAFQALKDQYPEELQRRFQQQTNDRFKRMRVLEKELEDQKKANEELWDAADPYLMRLGIERGDVAGFRAGAEKDKTNFNKRAYEKGTSVEEEMADYASMRQTAEKQRAAEAQQKAQEEAAKRQKAAKEAEERQKVFAGWNAEAEEIRRTDPDFDLRTAIRESEPFRKALDAGLGVKFAYNAVNHDRIMAGVAGAVAQKTAADVSKSIASRASRPNEGGVKAAAPGTVGAKDYSQMSDAEFLKLFHAMGY